MTTIVAAHRIVFARLAVLLLAMALSACASATRPPVDPAVLAVTPMGAADSPPGRLSAARMRAGERLEILALSGGGADGAFGAGVLRGWTESGRRPRFDIVTGVSTGALMSVFAFLGSRYDDLLEDLYTRTNNSRIYRRKPLLAGLTGASMYDYTPLKHEIERLIDDRLLDEIAREHRRGRRLYVATVNLDAGRLVAWDIGMIAASGHPRRTRIVQKILRASAAVPGFFKPVYIQPLPDNPARQMHVDGSVKAPFLLEEFMLRPAAREKSVWVVVNGRLRSDGDARAVKPNTIAISRRSIRELLRTMMRKTVFEAGALTRRHGGRYHVVSIPRSAPPTPDPLDFDPEHMRRLYEIGRRLGRGSLPRGSGRERMAAAALSR